MERILILDNDGTLSKFRNGNFSNTIGGDLTKNISAYVRKILGISGSEFEEIIQKIKSYGMQLSEGFEELYGIDRKDYFFNTWKDLNPEKYIVDRGNENLRNLLENQAYYNIMLTGSPKVRFEKTMTYLGYDLRIFKEIYTAEDFYHKKEIFQILANFPRFDIGNSIAIGDEEKDFVPFQELGGIGININNSSIYK